MVIVRGPEQGQVAEVPILVDGGPLCVAGAYSFRHNRCERGLYFIYQKSIGLRFGPFYPHIPFADKGMKKMLALGKHHWEHELAWYVENQWLKKWVDENIGKNMDLSGGQWVDENGNEVRPPPSWGADR